MEFNLSALGSAPAAEETYDVVIIGGGPAGLTAGIYAGRAQLKTVIVEKGLPGGQIAQTDEVENYPGFPEGISGPELASRMVRQAEKFGARIVMDEVLGLEKAEGGYLVRGYERNYRARAVIVATGANPRRLGVPGEDKFYGRGVSTCATCDGFFYRDKEVVVVGGGDAAVEEGIFLTKFARKVTLVHRRDELRANKVAQKRAFQNPKMHFLFSHVVTEILGEDQVTGVRLKNLKTGEEYVYPTDGVFVFIGHEPNTAFLKGVVELRPDGYIAVRDEVFTSEPGIFAAGDVADPIYRQLTTSVGAGTRAAMMAERYLAEEAEKVKG
ncbi:MULTISPECIES: thioredoxin-disulfide reductase [Thermus]|jgi:thioredoxin reductase (NADPH)|uniref:Thioredoxin reductase n=1 Tax=Thermus thermophilus (strain ATCC 27634 / DSM 579 / HB8) TaxID=300852 RepID=Q5SH10_THET8|nr:MULTISPECIES: thioredoxin-disulfide reductase [Thermus]QZY58482.1 thioredoxin-disulfide reductase [Thermus thermophilus]BAD71743.1 thioredoxin reductase [Thermus thermophilus HB8]BCP99038.1 thioredoxin reductase [Thermus thermophilus]BCQ01369.1 thioredoxin reductase [Thermus thermophilus]BDA38536.1 thioredoxin reductase [Thermus thermophilus]